MSAPVGRSVRVAAAIVASTLSVVGCVLGATGCTAQHRGPAAHGSTAQGSTAQGSTAQGSTAQGSTAQGSTAQASTAQSPARQPARGWPWQSPVADPGHLASGSDPSALPADVLIADHRNNRLLIVDPQGRVRWQFPGQPGDLVPGQTFLSPDDAFFSTDGRYIVATQEDDQVISLISVAARKIVFRFGTPGVAGSGPDQLANPDDAMLLPNGMIFAADIKNCRLVLITPGPHPRAVTRAIGSPAHGCWHDPPRSFGSPNGAFPMRDGHFLVTEINGDWVDELDLTGKVYWSAHPPGVLYPSDSNEVSPGRYLTVDYSGPGQIVEFDSHGRLLWRMGGFNHPSLALPLRGGDILMNDDFNHRVCVVDPVTTKIVWQYGHTGVSGRAAGYLDDPDGVDLVPPDQLITSVR